MVVWIVFHEGIHVDELEILEVVFEIWEFRTKF